MNAAEAGRVLAHERLSGRWALGAIVTATAVVASAAAVLHRESPEDAADVVLAGVVFGLAIPLFVYAAVARVCCYGRLDEAVRPFARHGGNRRWAALGLVSGTALRAAVASAALAALAVLVARGEWSRLTLWDAASSAWVGALGGAAYVSWFSLGSLLGRKGGGRVLAFLLDASAGAGMSWGALWPRAHLRSLIGGALVPGLGELQSMAVLCLLTVIIAGVSVALVPP